MYKLVTGFYPSKNSALKVLESIKGKCPEVTIEPCKNGYSIVICSSYTFETVYLMYQKYTDKKICCGIMQDLL